MIWYLALFIVVVIVLVFGAFSLSSWAEDWEDRQRAKERRV